MTVSYPRIAAFTRNFSFQFSQSSFYPLKITTWILVSPVLEVLVVVLVVAVVLLLDVVVPLELVILSILRFLIVVVEYDVVGSSKVITCAFLRRFFCLKLKESFDSNTLKYVRDFYLEIKFYV
jgi:hypothetical protein